MATERMLELLLLYNTKDFLSIDEKRIDGIKIYSRYLELMEEFLDPYVIDNAEKSE